MSKQWTPRIVPGRRPQGWAGQWDRHRWPVKGQAWRQIRRIGPRDIVQMVLAGILVGVVLLAAAAAWHRIGAGGKPGAAPAIRAMPLPDPYAEARRSRAILDGQDGPPPALAERSAATPLLQRTTHADPEAVRVIDGDTFDHGGVRIRIADIDTPEVNGRCPFETALAARATARMRALLAAGPFELHPINGRDEDRYGRKLRIVTRGGRSLGDRLVAEGLARTWSGRREPWC
jgi:endonuclease YncB( thermonuclease family)